MLTEKVKTAIQQYYAAANLNLSEKPDWMSEKYWDLYSDAEKFTGNEPRGERGVKVESRTSGDGSVIKIYGVIYPWTLGDFDYFLSQIDGKVTVRLASPGGDSYVGLQIYNIIRKRGNVLTETDGPIASAASIVFLGGSERKINKTGSHLMVHQSWAGACFAGKVEEWEAFYKDIAKALKIIDENMIEALEDRSKLSRSKSEKYIREETYFTSKQCVENGIATGYCAEAEADDNSQGGSNDDTFSAEETSKPQSSGEESGKKKKKSEDSVKTEVADVKPVASSLSYLNQFPVEFAAEID